MTQVAQAEGMERAGVVGLRSAERKGHQMGRFETAGDTQTAQCNRCFCLLVVSGRKMWGRALTENCPTRSAR